MAAGYGICSPARTRASSISEPGQGQGQGEGQVYPLHFEVPYRHAQDCSVQHWTEDLPTRLNDHGRGRGARLMEVISAAGIRFTLARTWPGTRALERRLKDRGGHARLCPICHARRTAG